MIEKFLILIEKYPMDYVTDFIPLLPIFVGLIRKPFLSVSFNIVLYWLIIVLSINVLSIYYVLHRENNMFLYNVKDLIELGIVGIIFFRFFNNYKIKQYILLFALGLAILANFLMYARYEISGNSQVVNNCFFIIVIFLYYHCLLSELIIDNLLLHSNFWLSASILISATGTMLIFLFSSITLATTTESEIFDRFLVITQIIEIICNLMLCYAFWVLKFDNNRYIYDKPI